MDAFKIGRQQASKDINWYKRQFPDNLDYDLALKGHVPTKDFQPQFTQGQVDEYLQIQKANMDLSLKFADAFNTVTSTEVLLPPARGVKPEVVRPVIQACKENRRLDIDYISLSSPEQADGRLICPHTLVNNGFRWHIRAYCEKNQQFRDFVLSRIRGIPEVEDKSDYRREQDEAWNTEVNLVIVPHHELTEPQKQVIATDYGMEDGQLIIKTKGALVEYMLQLMHIDKQSTQRSAIAQQLEIANFDEIKPWCFG